jgi:hypothetical protein
MNPVMAFLSLSSDNKERIPALTISDLPENPYDFWILSISASIFLLSDMLTVVNIDIIPSQGYLYSYMLCLGHHQYY